MKISSLMCDFGCGPFHVAHIVDADSVNGRDGKKYLRSFLTLPLYFSHSNHLNPSINQSSADTPAPMLEPDLYTTAYLAKSRTRAVLAPWTVIFFLTTSTILLVVCLIGLACAMMVQGPHITGFPVLDFGTKLAASEQDVVNLMAGAAGQTGAGFVGILRRKRLYLRELKMPQAEIAQDDSVESNVAENVLPAYSLNGNVGTRLTRRQQTHK